LSSDRPGRIVMAVDMDYFYAQCEELRNPSFSGKPIVVGMYSGRTDISGAVATANYPARRYGVKSGIPLYRAKSMLKDTESLFVKADFDYYEEVSSRIMGILRSYSKLFVQVSIDEAFLDISGPVGGDYRKAEELAKEVKGRILKETRITCSVGVGPNKLIAKMACDSAKPNGLFVVRPDQVEAFLKDKPLDALYGVGGKTAERMKELGVKTVGELSSLSLYTLQKEFGRKLGEYFYLAARGIDEEPLEEKEREQLGRMLTLKEDTRDISQMMSSISEMARDLTKELASRSMAYRTVTVIVVDTELLHHSRSKSLRTKEVDLEVAIQVSRELLSEFFEQNPAVFARRLGLTLSSLSKWEGQKPISAYFK
jgi:DNA polymerase IV (DinB-like DNA polymerase)